MAQCLTSEVLTLWDEGGCWYIRYLKEMGGGGAGAGQSDISLPRPLLQTRLRAASAQALPPVPRGGWGTGRGCCQPQMPLQTPLPLCGEGLGNTTRVSRELVPLSFLATSLPLLPPSLGDT